MYSALGNYSLQIFSFFTIIVMLRLLAAEEIGIYAVVGSAILVASKIRNPGVFQCLTKRKNINEANIGTVLCAATLVSQGLGMVIMVELALHGNIINAPNHV